MSMLLTCHRCPRQIAFAGDFRARSRMARLFGWLEVAGRFFCPGCGGEG